MKAGVWHQISIEKRLTGHENGNFRRAARGIFLAIILLLPVNRGRFSRFEPDAQIPSAPPLAHPAHGWSLQLGKGFRVARALVSSCTTS